MSAVGQRGALGAWLSAASLLALYACTAHCDVIFRVPEVMVRHAAAPRAVGTGRSNVTRNESDQWTTEDSLLEVRYEEYFVDHEVSTADARRVARALNLDDVPEGIGCGTCSKRDMEYCETRVLADHCCCDMHIAPEPFPWLPHTCYIGPHRCKPLASDCVLYTRLRDCCCKKKLAERWKGILSKSTRLGVSGISLLLLSMLLFVAYL